MKAVTKNMGFDSGLRAQDHPVHGVAIFLSPATVKVQSGHTAWRPPKSGDRKMTGDLATRRRAGDSARGSKGGRARPRRMRGVLVSDPQLSLWITFVTHTRPHHPPVAALGGKHTLGRAVGEVVCDDMFSSGRRGAARFETLLRQHHDVTAHSLHTLCTRTSSFPHYTPSSRWLRCKYIKVCRGTGGRRGRFAHGLRERERERGGRLISLGVKLRVQ